MSSQIFDPSLFLQAIRSILPEKEFIALHEPKFTGNEWDYVKECLDTGWVSSVGKFVQQFEERLAGFTGADYAVAVVNGTAALHASLLVTGVAPDDEVLIPALTFIATANAVAYCGAVPHFVDSDEKTLGVDPDKLEEYLSTIAVLRDEQCFNKVTGRRIRALIVMHTFGHPVDLDPIEELCARYHMVLVEDAAESLGSYYKGVHTGNRGTVAALSFNGNKIITTGGGGAILTNDGELAKRVKHLTTTAKLPHRWEFIHDEIGYNYRLPNINAALGCAQLEQIPTFIRSKRRLAHRYQDVLSDVPGITFFKEPEFAQSNYWLNAVLLDQDYAHERDRLLAMMNDEGIMSRPAWKLMSELDMYSNCPRMNLDSAISISGRLVNLPSSVWLGGSDE